VEEGWRAVGHGVELGSRRSKVSRVVQKELWFQSRTMDYSIEECGAECGVRCEVRGVQEVCSQRLLDNSCLWW